ncbi:MAG: carboxypeptidase-like regulatory domain-containing protein, partial [Bacteroidota bacterium]
MFALLKPFVFLLPLFWACNLYSQTATIAGTVLDGNNQPIPDVNITAGALGATTDTNGYYILQLIAETSTT